MRRIAAFVLGVAVMVGIQTYLPDSGYPDPLPDPSEVQRSIRRLNREVSSAQRPALADGRVDPSEYRSAVLARIACLRSSSTPSPEVKGPFPTARGRLLSWHYRVPGDGVEATKADRRCAAQHSDVIEHIWRLQVVPQGEARARELEELADCLRAHGARVMGKDVRSVLNVAATTEVPIGVCGDRHAVLFDL